MVNTSPASLPDLLFQNVQFIYNNKQSKNWRKQKYNVIYLIVELDKGHIK